MPSLEIARRPAFAASVRHRSVHALAAVLALALVLHSGPAQGASAAELERAAQCARVDAGADRLACYDAVFRPGASAAPDDAFGLERRRAARAAEELESVREVRSRIASIRELPDSRRLVTLENGQAWRTTEADGGARWRTGDELVITRGALRSFRASVAGSSRVTGVRRER